MNSPQSLQDLSPAALAGVRVVEMGQLIAGPFCGKTLGEFGRSEERRVGKECRL